MDINDQFRFYRHDFLSLYKKRRVLFDLKQLDKAKETVCTLYLLSNLYISFISQCPTDWKIALQLIFYRPKKS